MTEVHTCILWRFLSLGKEPIKSSKREVCVASSCVSVKTESLLPFPTDASADSGADLQQGSCQAPPHHESVDLEIYFQSLGQ